MVEWNEDGNDLIESFAIHFVPRAQHLVVTDGVLSRSVGSRSFEKLYVIRVLARRIRTRIRECIRPHPDPL